MFDDFKKKIKDPESQEHGALLAHVKGLIDKSRKTMARHYDTWDYNDAVFRSEKKVDKEDRTAAANGKPTKMIVPLVFSQVMTFVTYNVSTLSQNKRFFELEPTGSEDNPLREACELVLERDCRRNSWTAFLVQFFLDIGRFSLGAAEVCYEEKYRKIRVEETTTEPQGIMGEEVSTTESVLKDVPVFVGNKVVPISPYRFFPDLSLPLTRYQEGEFCGSEDIFTLGSLQGDENLFNVDKIPKFTETDFKGRKQISRVPELGLRTSSGSGHGTLSDSDYCSSGDVIVTKAVLDIVPKHFYCGEGDDKKNPLGDADYRMRYLVWYANDQTIIRFEEADYLHGMFPYICAQFLPDQHKTINEGLSDACDQITSLITWLMNAHVTSIRSNIESKLVVDPAGVDMRSLESRGPYIYLKKHASNTGVDRYIKQLQVSDPTVNFMSDIAALKGILGEVTGYNETMHGQYSAGRRSATQDRVVAQAGSARGRTTLAAIWDSAFEPLGKQLLANNRAEISRETFNRLLGSAATDELFALFKADAVTIAGAEDFFTFDGTLPSEKAFLAQSLQEIFMTMMQNPQVAAVMGFGPEELKQIFEDIYSLRGVTQARLPVRKIAQPQTSDPSALLSLLPQPAVV